MRSATQEGVGCAVWRYSVEMASGVPGTRRRIGRVIDDNFAGCGYTPKPVNDDL